MSVVCLFCQRIRIFVISPLSFEECKRHLHAWQHLKQAIYEPRGSPRNRPAHWEAAIPLPRTAKTGRYADWREEDMWKLRAKKIPGMPGIFHCLLRLFWTNIRCLLALGASRYIEGNPLVFLQRLEAAGLDCGEVRKQIFATFIRSNETKTLRVVKPLYDTSCHTNSYFS